MRLVRAGTVAALAVLIAACAKTNPVEPTAEVAECSRCHGYPPPPFIAGGTSHTTNTQCSLCHPGTVEADNITIVPGGLHLDGVVEAVASHDIPYPAHPSDALADIVSCTVCHGTDYAGGTVNKSCNDCHATNVAASAPDWKTNCTFCHGTRTAGVTTATALAAPPEAVVTGGDQTHANPKVGAHQAHLTDGTFATALPCASCHTVPDAAAGLTHFVGNGAPATISFSALATQGVTSAAYAGGSCAVYCHGSGTELAMPAGTTSPAWTSTVIACGDCHGLPPSTGPSLGSPAQPAHAFHVGAGAACADCHLNYTGTSVDLAVHVNGTKDVVVQPSTGGPVTITGWDCQACHTAKNIPFATHAVPYPTHTTDALAGIAACTGCHGADYGGGLGGLAPSCNACHASSVAASAPDWKTNCTFCHGTRTADVATATPLAAPPEAVVGGGDQTNANPRVGAHQAHLNSSALRDALPCSTCHTPPAAAQSLTHFTGGAATLTFDALASRGVTASYAGNGGACAVYCHGSGTGWPSGSVAANPTPAWTSTGLACNACHGIPPATGPTVVGSAAHLFHVNTRGQACSRCHNGYTDTTVNPATHVDGTRDVIVTPTTGGSLRISGWDCTACHTALGV